jgi:phospholipid/cholesterol/gamma-HCH transport system permease protein
VRDQLQTPLTLIGGFFRMCVLTGRALFRWPFQWREFVLQCWFIMRVAFLPTIMVSIPLTVLLIFTLNVLLAQFGAADLSGAGAAIGAVTQLGPLTTVLVVAGAGSTAICADLGARTVREEIDALKVMGISPVQRLVAPRLLAALVVALLLTVIVSMTAMVTAYVLNVGGGKVSAGAYLDSFVAFSQPPDFALAAFKALVFGFIATIVAAHKGLSASGGPKGVADAVNQAVVLSVILLALANVAITQAYVMLVPQGVA